MTEIDTRTRVYNFYLTHRNKHKSFTAEICNQLLANPNDMRFFKRIVTSDEKWIYFRNPNQDNQWFLIFVVL